MNWFTLAARAVLMVLLVCGLLYWADIAVPMGGLVVFLLVLCIVATWAIISLLKDDDLLASFFDD